MKKYLISETLLNKICDFLGEGKLKDSVQIWMELKSECANQPEFEIKPTKEEKPK